MINMNKYTAVIQRDGDFWVGWIEEISGVNSQGSTRAELLENLQSALQEALQMNRLDARSAAGKTFEEVQISRVKRRKLLSHLRAHGCELVREGGKHSWWGNLVTGARSAIPRHSEISDVLCRKICKDLGVEEP